MSTLARTLRKHLRIRPSIVVICLVGLGGVLIAPAVFGDGDGAPERQYIMYDDITNRVNAGPETGPQAGTPDMGAPSSDPAPAGNSGDQGNGSGQDNNGHGNNADGVDVSNPGQGQGGPTGQVDPSCDGSGPCVDDETGNNGTGGN